MRNARSKPTKEMTFLRQRQLPKQERQAKEKNWKKYERNIILQTKLQLGMGPSLFFSNSNELELSILELERVEFSPSNSNRTEPNRTFELF